MQAFVTSAGWREQYDRMLRWYERFQRIEQGRTHDIASENYLDEIYAFFQNCHHLKDWLRKDSSLPHSIRSAVENHINSQRALRLSADICNGLKHLERDKSKPAGDRSKENPKLGKKKFNLDFGARVPMTISLKYEIKTDTGRSIDAFVVATECVNAWKAFLTAHGLGLATQPRR